MSANVLRPGTITNLQTTGASATLTTGSVVVAATNDLLNQNNLDRFASFLLTTNFVTAPTVGDRVDLYLVPMFDGTNAADVDTSTPYLNPQHYRDSFVVEKSTNAAVQRLTIEGVRLRPTRYRAYLWNRTTQSLAAGWTLDAYGEADQSI